MATSTRRNLTVVDTGGSPEGANDDLVGSIKRYVDAALFPIRSELLVVKGELEALKSRPEPQPARDGLPGVPGPAGRDGRDGERGVDGLGFDDLHVLRTGEREIVFELTKGERVRRFPVYVPAIVYRGVHKNGQAYELGDLVTWAGGLWHANASTDTKPGNGNPNWTLCTKAGRDGKDGRSAYQVAVDRAFKGSEDEWLKSLRGPPGPRGQDLRHLG